MIEEPLFSFESPEASWEPPTLQTPRLILRPALPDDLEQLFEICSNPNMTLYTMWETHRSRDETRFFIENYAGQRKDEKVPEPMIAISRESGEIVGTLGCFWADRTHRIMELGYNIGEKWWGQGFAAEASKSLMAYVFAEYKVTRLQARVFAENAASVRVAEKLGMTFEGILRCAVFRRGRHSDLRMFSLLRSEWEMTEH